MRVSVGIPIPGRLILLSEEACNAEWGAGSGITVMHGLWLMEIAG